MNKSRKLLSLCGILMAPVALSALSFALPNLGLVMMFLLTTVGSSPFVLQFLVVLGVAAAFGLVSGQADPLRPFALAML